MGETCVELMESVDKSDQHEVIGLFKNCMRLLHRSWVPALLLRHKAIRCAQKYSGDGEMIDMSSMGIANRTSRSGGMQTKR
jgi:hypothetical protein